MVQRISPRIRSQGWLQMTIHCMLEIRRCYMCNYIIPRQANTVPLPPAVPTASATVQPTCATPSEQSQ
jgi:hypothetical protein